MFILTFCDSVVQPSGLIMLQSLKKSLQLIELYIMNSSKR